MWAWQGNSEEYSDSDPHLAELFRPREWEMRQREKKLGDFWWHFSIFVGVITALIFVSTVSK